MHLMVVEAGLEVKLNAPVYGGDADVGVVPFVVQNIEAPGVLVATETDCVGQ